MRKRLNIKGETLAETIIALSVLAIGITISGTVIMNSMRNLANAKNRVIAVNIAREGIEAVRGLRDTNWLLYSDKRRQCWNHDPSAGICNPPHPIPPGTYIVYKYTDGSWRLQLADKNPLIDSDSDGNSANDLDLAALSLVDIDNTVDSDNADKDNDTNTGSGDDLDMYNHMKTEVDHPFGTEVKITPYSRYIVIEYLENKPDSTSPPSNIDSPDDSISSLKEWKDSTNDPDSLNRMRVTSAVSWFNRGIPYSVELTTILTDHLGRTDLTS